VTGVLGTHFTVLGLDLGLAVPCPCPASGNKSLALCLVIEAYHNITNWSW